RPQLAEYIRAESIHSLCRQRACDFGTVDGPRDDPAAGRVHRADQRRSDQLPVRPDIACAGVAHAASNVRWRTIEEEAAAQLRRELAQAANGKALQLVKRERIDASSSESSAWRGRTRNGIVVHHDGAVARDVNVDLD